MSQVVLTQTARRPDAPVDDRFVQRWSPRAFAADPVPAAVLDSVFEAARWAPSAYNAQPWSYHVTTDGPGRERMDAAIVPFNRSWSDAAPVVVWVVASVEGEHGPNPHAWFDTGAATMSLLLQAQEHGLAGHAMGGIDADAAHALLGLGDDEQVVCALALGYPGDPDALPEPLREREAPSPRRPTAEFVRHL